MIALAEIVTEKLSLKQRILRPFSGDDGVDVYEEKTLGMPVLRIKVRLPRHPRARTVEARLCRAMDVLDKMRIKNVCYHDGFSYKSEFLQEKFLEADDNALWKLKAAEIAGRAAASRDSVFFISSEIGESEQLTAERLCRIFRHISISSRGGTAKFCRRVFDKTGVSIVSKSAPFGKIFSDAAVLFSVPEKIECAGAAVVSGGVLPEEVEGFGKIVTAADFCLAENLDTPEGYNRSSLISAACDCGAVKEDSVIVNKIEIQSFRKWEK